MHQVTQGVVAEIGEGQLLALGRQPTQHRVDEPAGARDPGCPHAAYRLVHRRRDGDALGEQDLVGPQSQGRRHQGLELGEVPVQQLPEVVVDATAPAQGAVDEIGREGAVGGGEVAARQRRVQ